MSSEGFWWAALAVAALSAGTHFVSMLRTHWGDHKVSAKALGFSLLFHAALFCALFAIGPKISQLIARPSHEAQPVEEVTPIDLHELITDADRPQPSREAGNVPVWEKPTEQIVSPTERSDRQADLSALDDPDRAIEEMATEPSLIPPADTLASLPDQAPEQLDSPIEEMIPAPAEAPLIADSAPPEARSEEFPSLARRDPASDFAPGAMEPLDRTLLPDASPQPDMQTDPLADLADLSDLADDASLPQVNSPTDGMLIRRPNAPTILPEESSRQDPEVASGSEGTDRATTMIGRRGPTASGTAPAAPETSRQVVDSPEREFAPGTAPEFSSMAPIAPEGIDQPALARIEDRSSLINRPRAPETYQLRQLDNRSDVARRNGGSQASEEAVELSLRWLAANQHPDGYWDADEYGAGQVGIDEEGVDRQYAGKTSDSGLTALTILAFLGAGYTHQEGPYQETVRKGLNWLIQNQRRDGFLGGDAAHFEQMYCHGMATYALAEAYGMEGASAESPIRRPLLRGIDYILEQQGEDGGWRYVKGQKGDMSMFGWQLMALKSAEIAGIPIARNTRTKMVNFLKDRSLGETGGLAGYREGMPATAPMTAEALFCKQMLGITRANPQSQEAVSFLLQHRPKRSTLNFYYWYYGTLAMYQYGGTAWDQWNAALRDLLVAEQVREGDLAGSWDPKDEWGPYGGRIYSTAVATMSLEVYYRFLPLYRAGSEH